MTFKDISIFVIFFFFSFLAFTKSPVQLSKAYKQAAATLEISEESLPVLEISVVKTKGASYNKDSNIIFFDQKLFDLCLNLNCNPEAAFLFILGHELGHFIEGQNHPYGFIEHLQTDENYQLELKADYFGIVSCISNGYKTSEMINELFIKITEAYQPEPNEKYLSATARIEKVNNLKLQIKKFSYVYEIGKYLLQVGAIDQALACYSYLKQYLQIPEILNDWSTCNLIWSLEAYRILAFREVSGFNLKDINYAFPFELDPDARLFQKATKGIALAEESNEYIRKAIKKVYGEVHKGYHQSKNIRPDYLDININLSLFHLLKNPEYNEIKYDSVDFYINKGYQLNPTPNQFYKLRMIEGIYLDLLNKKTASQRILGEMKENNSAPQYLREMAKTNLELSITNHSDKVGNFNNSPEKVLLKMGPPFSVIFPDKNYMKVNLQGHVIYVKEENEYKTLSFDRKYNFRIPNDGKSIAFLNETNTSILERFYKPHQLFHDKSHYYYIYEGGVCFGFNNVSNRLNFNYIFRIP
ncbi:MAG: hypothetical protein KTR26_10485 [Flammeovirgaceae bacterium]|nr:hypothetical protein [Flammeovirgaceae bacterium]